MIEHRYIKQFTEIFNEVTTKKNISSNQIHLNENTHININPVEGIRWINVGDAGSGKTYLMAVVGNQTKNCTIFDPTAKFRDTLKEMGCEKDWMFYEFNKKNNSQSFKINVRDLNERIIDSLFPRTEDTAKKRQQRQAIEDFLKENETKPKTYDDWEQMCEDKDLELIKKDLDYILSSKDAAPDISFWGTGRKVIDCEGITVKNPAIGVFLQAFIGMRSKLSKSYVLNLDNFVLFCLDEAQSYCRQDTPLGNAFAKVNTEARKYGIGELLVGAGYDTLHPEVRARWNMALIFNSKGLVKKYRGEGIDLILDDMSMLERHKYHCFMFSKDGKFNRRMILPDTYFLEVRNNKKTPAFLIEREEIEYSFNFSKR